MGKNEPAGITDAPKKKGTNHNAIIALILILVGLGVLLYPVVATQWNNHNQSRAAEEYAKLEKQAPPEVLHTAWEEAQAYNAGWARSASATLGPPPMTKTPPSTSATASTCRYCLRPMPWVA